MTRRWFFKDDTIKWYFQAVLTCGIKYIFCHWCKFRFSMTDDIGFYILHPTDDTSGACCRKCYNGKHGDAHRVRYGRGDR